MISDDDLYRLALFLGSVAMLLIVLYHFFEVNSQEDGTTALKVPRVTSAQPTTATAKQSPTPK
ncbi:Oligosaccaryltransferase-domain-containing protein [Nemania abortiva]|nr:Oligosaccaryltransferase-domain-containing protein [Nemania abortiva]